MQQTQIDSDYISITAENLRDNGIAQSFATAESKYPNWALNAYNFLKEYMQSNKEFMAEDVRIASNGIIAIPPSTRAWGCIFVKAVRSGLIKRKGFKSVKNKKAHCTPATFWEVC